MKVIKFLSVLMLFAALMACSGNGITNKKLETEQDSVSYSLGLDIATKLKINFGEVDKDLFIQGVSSGLDSIDILVDPTKVDSILGIFFRKRQAEMRIKQQEEATKRLESEFAHVREEGDKFLAENKSKPGVITTESGLQYIVMKEGAGESPGATSQVKVHYHGTLLDGRVFDSSVDKGEPSTFYANQVITGWTEGLQLMSPGAKFKFFVPQDLGYGAFPRQGGIIEPFAALVFEVELLEILKK